MAERRAPASLARHGFSRPDRAEDFLADPALEGISEQAAAAFGRCADPDAALLGLLRIAESAREHEDPATVRALEQVLGGLGTPEDPAALLVRLLGASVALGDVICRHPELLIGLLERSPRLDVPVAEVRRTLLEAVEADPDARVPVAGQDGRTARDGLRLAYHRRLLEIALVDLGSEAPTDIEPEVSGALADLAGAALDTALAVARAAVDGHEQVRLAVIAMGKTGAHELNYISDVDVLYVADGVDAEQDEEEVTSVSAALCRELARVCSDRTGEGSLWQVDANLRPEGKDGPLTRSLDSYHRYYTRWAESWEFQALLKARAVAGDRALGEAFEEMVAPWVWQASTRDGFVEDSRAMRRRVIAHIPHGEVDRNIKLGPGGLRDVEFTVQLLQMVHGRTDDEVHAHGTLDALAQLGAGGYISRDHVVELDDAYRFLRCVEHRLQLHRLRRTQVLPTADADVRRLARALRMPPEDFRRHYDRTRRRVRHLHEEIFYRPLLVTSARLSDGEVMLTPEAARSRLAAIGYRDPGRAMTHIEALTDGLSRRAAIQRQLLPALLEWFAAGIDPDLGLLSFRRLSEELGSVHWYLGQLRDSGIASQRLTRVLSSSRYVGQQFEQISGAVRWLSKDQELQPLDRRALHDEFLAVISRVDGIEDAGAVLRRTRRRELLRIALGQLCGLLDEDQVARGLSDLAEAVLEAGLLVAYYGVARDRGVIGQDAEPSDGTDERTLEELRERRSDPARALGVELALLAMGSLGAREMGYASDADVQFVVVDRGAGQDAGKIGIAVATTLQKILNAPASGADMKVNADLRPEGRSGLLARSLEGWRSYYRRDALVWEKQALTRCRVIVASRDLSEELTAEMDRHRYPDGGLDADALREIRHMKARIESERLPRGADPSRHVKLGRGGMTDVEWVAQLLILEHGGARPELRRTGTLPVLRAAVEAELLSRRDAEELEEAWRLAWQIRNAVFLWKGRASAQLPSDRNDLRAVARIVLGDDGTASDLEETYLRAGRRARSTAEQILFGSA